MVKQILTLAFTAALCFGTPVSANAAHAIEIIDNDFQGIEISVTDSRVHISGANGQVLYIYNVAGVCVMQVKVDGHEKTYDLSLPKGCYILKVGKVTRKISIR
ncbi:MAG: T9SS type A sorting domain-containing protein [Prevotella sp.]